ncbi:unnamed protein product [Dovyalis caffra]|uniref:DNA polymerase zeta catalytic subunit n=1 Tax=Dovyalis caffra TaxID=77055 RepID=A0AAV1RYP3_9ROSI|nr:unnamed protein product [Dovyalis caffra]
MADSQSYDSSKIFSLRIVSIDHYMSPPIPSIDICYSSFQGGKVNEVPVIRVYGSTPAGQKTCLHVHQAFPYLYVPCSDIPVNGNQEGDAYTNAISLALEKALKLKGNAGSKRQHVHGCSLVRAKKFYGYHSEEELFVKIYLYHPHDVSRAANLLLAGAVFEKSLQPHESHIPFILQFLVDYNLYGMGHLHLSKMKFRHPVPDSFTPRKFSNKYQDGLEIDESTCISADFQADSSGGQSMASPVWISSTIPGGWMWQFSNEFDAPSDQDTQRLKRQSVCHLEGDATIDDILNQQYKMYTSLSQAHSDVKMVQSLIPIWEEEHERTGINEAATLPDPEKPFPGDVLRTLLHAFEFERKLSELYIKTEGDLPSSESNVNFLPSATSTTDGENLVEHENVNSDNANGEFLKCSAERDTIQSSAQGSVCEEEIVATPTEMKNLSLKLSSEIIGTVDPKVADEEALGLLRWLATSQAAEDINSDDELVRETILSPLLPAATIDKVLEKANTDYESESQKECQDILDSIEDLVNFEDLKEKASHSVDHSLQTSLEKNVPQADTLHSSPSGSVGSSFKAESKSKFKRYSQDQIFQTTGSSISNKQKRNRSLWCSLPFSTNQKVNDDSEVVKSSIADIHVDGSKNSAGTVMTGNEEAKCSDALLNADKNACEASSLVGCSVRDMMRRKRCRQTAQHDDGSAGVKNICLEGKHEECNILFPKQLDLHILSNDGSDKRLHGSLDFRSSVNNQQPDFLEICASKSIPHAFSSASSTQVGTNPLSLDTSREELQCIFTAKKQDAAVSMVHCETNKGGEFDFGGVTSIEPITSGVNNSKSDSLPDNWLSKHVLMTGKRLERPEAAGSNCFPALPIDHDMFARESYKSEYVHQGGSSKENLYDIPTENLIGMEMSVDGTVLQSENFCAAKQGGDSDLSALGKSAPLAVKMAGETVDLLGMTFCKKPPTAEWKDGAAENVSFSPGPSFLSSSANAKTKDRTSDEHLPFFDGDYHENKGVPINSSPNIDYNVQQEVIIGVPTHYLNDGSALYLLTPVFSPPSVDSVYRWLSCGNNDALGEVDGVSAEPLPVKGSSEIGSQNLLPIHCDKVLTEQHAVAHLMPILDQAPQELNTKVNAESHIYSDEAQRKLQSEGNTMKLNPCNDCPVDISQISGPDRRSRPTPLSQIGFRDPASVGAGQQLTLLSIEVQAESRGDLRPDPRFDAINMVVLAFQNDSDFAVEVHVLLHSKSESCQRSFDGTSGCKVLVFSEEKHLFSHFMAIISSFDPDILMGWDVQGGSLGFLAERAAHLGIGLLNKISRTPLEADIGVGEREISEKGILDTMLQESLITDSALVEDAVIEDEWGRTHASGVHVGGRVVLNVWRLMHGEVKLNMYTVEAVGEAVLRQKIPSIPYKVLTKWFASGPGRARHRCIEYVIERAKLNLEIMNRLDMINRTSELARVFGIDFFSVLSRGSQYRVESMFLRLAHTQNYLAISPGNQQVASQPAMECLPLVMEPESGFYADPVVVLDFQSLYPSMIIAYNLCFCTCLGNVAPSKANTLGVSSFSPDPRVLQDLKDKILLTPNGIMYVPSEIRKGILPRLLDEILSTRIMVKQAMKKLAPSQQVLHRIFNARQLALKLIANVTYGYTAAGFSGRMPCAELADSIVQCGRSTLEKAISLVNENEKWKAKVIYGDTDSMFVLLKGRTVKESFQIGREIASAVTAINPDPVILKLEKVYHPCFLLTKKRYVGYSYESPDQIEPVFDAKGIETVRRDTCGAVAKIMEQSLRIFFEHQDIFEVEIDMSFSPFSIVALVASFRHDMASCGTDFLLSNPETYINEDILDVKTYLQRQWKRILSGRVSLQDFVFAKEVRLGTYSARASSSLPPAAIVATKAMRADPRAEPCYAERVPYVVIHGEPGARLVDMVVDPLDLLAIDSPFRLNDVYYITKQIIPALQRVFGLLGADLNQWFSEMPRPAREVFAKRPSYAPNPQRTRIDYYYLSKHCVLCGELVQASAHLCNKCSQREAAAATAVIGRTSKLEKEMQHLAAICRHCGGGDWLLESGIKCTSLACSVFYLRRKVQKELQALSAVAEDKGFYPKCMPISSYTQHILQDEYRGREDKCNTLLTPRSKKLQFPWAAVKLEGNDHIDSDIGLAKYISATTFIYSTP